jgi:hypothetical protein
MANQGQQLEVKVEVPNGHQIDDADGHAFLEQCRTLGDKDISMFRSILVGRTDDLNGRDQVPSAPRIKDFNLVLIVMNARLGNIPVWQLLSQLLDDDRWPLTVETLPRSDVIQRRAKVIA